VSRGVRFASRQRCDTCGEDILFQVHDDAFGARYVTVAHGKPGESSHLRRSDPILVGGTGRYDRLEAAMMLVTHAVVQRTGCLDYAHVTEVSGWGPVSRL
jgi:hypothetical protein